MSTSERSLNSFSTDEIVSQMEIIENEIYYNGKISEEMQDRLKMAYLEMHDRGYEVSKKIKLVLKTTEGEASEW